jgi:hypothetical protein
MDPFETPQDLQPALRPHSPAAGPASARSLHWPSIWQLGLSLLGVLGLWGGAGTLLVLGFSQMMVRAPLDETTQLFMLSVGLGFFGLLLLPSGAFALARLANRPMQLPAWLKLERAAYGIWLLPIVLLVGHWISTRTTLAWLLLPPLHLFGMGFPILLLLWLGGRGLGPQMPRRTWGIFSVGLVGGPLLILLAEVLAAGAILLMGSLFLASRPELVIQVQSLADDLRLAGQNMQAILQIMEPYLLRPEVGFTLLTFVAGIVPLIEELIKPIGVWLLVGRQATPADGFFAGLLSGAGYALFENLALASQTQDWALAVVARSGTSLIHMATAGLTGWALVEAWRRGRYGRLVMAFLGAILIHGAWNGLTLLTLGSVLETGTDSYLALLRPLATVAPLGLGLLVLLCVALLVGLNRRLQRLPEAGNEPSPALE